MGASASTAFFVAAVAERVCYNRRMKLLRWIAGTALGAALAYWLIVIGEGTYFGRPAVRLVYRFGAPIYDRVRAGVTQPDAAVLGGPLRLALLARPWAPALDVATGTGRVPLLLAQEPWYTGSIHGLDLTPQMLELARRKAAAAGVADRCIWHCGTGDRLERWPADHFGLVTCLEAIEYFPRPWRALREMWRVLAPGGTLLVSTWTPRHARWLPGKALTAVQIRRRLREAGCWDLEIRPWQSGYDLLLAVKPAG